MSLRRLLQALLIAAAPAAMAPTASASDLDFGIGVQLGKRSSISVSVGNRGRGYGYGRRCAPKRVWVPGRYEIVTEKVWVPGRTRKVWCDPVYETRYDPCGRPYTVCVSPGRWTTVTDPGCYEYVERKVWVPGHYRTY